MASMRLACLFLLGVTTLPAADTLQMFGHKWTVPVKTDWQLAEGANPVLRLTQSRGPLPGPRRPIQFALLDAEPFEHITLELDIKPLGRSCILVFAYRDPAHFNYAHLSTDTGNKIPVHNGIFHVYGGERVRISDPRGPAAFAATGQWYHVILRFSGETGVVDVVVNGDQVPALHAVDVSLHEGRIGLGSFDETGDFKNVKVMRSPL